MSVNPATTETNYNLVGVNVGPFNTVWTCGDPSELSVTLNIGAALQQLVAGTDYTVVSVDPLDNGLQVTLNAGLTGAGWPDGASVTLRRTTPNGQPASFGEALGFSPAAAEAALDNLARQMQELDTRLGRAVRAAPGDSLRVLPLRTARILSVMGFDAAGDTEVIPLADLSRGPKGDPGGNAMAVGLFTGIGGIAVPVGTDLIQTSGYGATGVGAARYSLVGAGPATAYRIETSNGRWFELAEEFPTARQYGAKGDGATDDSAALNAALAHGKDFMLTGGQYLANNLLQTTNNQKIVAIGQVQIIKNANGPLFSSSASGVHVHNVQFRGDAAAPVFTGDNVSATGDDFHLINCGSRWAAGRAVKATGDHVVILGTNDVYQTADATGTGYDIEIGKSGTATLYHELIGVRTSQNTGGILLIDTGDHHINGGQFGKLYIKKGTGPAGTNGGKTEGARILGAITVEASSAIFTGVRFGNVAITLAAGSSGISLGLSNTFDVGATVINNGNANNTIVRQVSTGGVSTFRYGGDASFYDETYDPPNSVKSVVGSLKVGIQGKLLARNAGNTADLNIYNGNGSDSQFFGDPLSNFCAINAGAGGLYAAIGGASVTLTTGGYFAPYVDNAMNLGNGSARWAQVYAGNATIQTSDGTTKQDVAAIDDAVLDAWAAVDFVQFRFIDAVQAKGDGARLHVGVIAQRLEDAFRAKGLDPFAYGLLCHDTWEAHEVVEGVDKVSRGFVEVTGDDGETRQVEQFEHVERMKTIPAGSIYGVRYEQALVLEAALMRRELTRLKAAAIAPGS